MRNKKKTFDYFQSFINMSNYALQEAQILQDYLANFDPLMLEAKCNEIHKLEHACDGEKHAMTTELIRDFLPPVDREDLFRLAHVTDNLTDSVEHIMDFLYMANITKLRDDVAKFTAHTLLCCQTVVELMKEFRTFKKSDKIKSLLILLNDYEEQGDKLYFTAVHTLSCTATTTREVIEWRDIYKIFENSFDSAESVADNIESIIMKNS